MKFCKRLIRKPVGWQITFNCCKELTSISSCSWWWGTSTKLLSFYRRKKSVFSHPFAASQACSFLVPGVEWHPSSLSMRQFVSGSNRAAFILSPCCHTDLIRAVQAERSLNCRQVSLTFLLSITSSMDILTTSATCVLNNLSYLGYKLILLAPGIIKSWQYSELRPLSSVLKSRYFAHLHTRKCVCFIRIHSNWDKITGIKVALNLLLLKIITSVLPGKNCVFSKHWGKCHWTYF